MPKLKEILMDARTLADFSNLEPAQVEYFRNNHPGFIPDRWWDYKNGVQWQKTQNFLRTWWKWDIKAKQDISSLVRIVSSVFDPGNIFPGQFEDALDLPTFAAFDEMTWGAPFQRAVLHIYEHPWRARFCAECKKRFVAVEPKNKFCSDKCSNENRLRQKLKAWHAHKHEWRQKSRKSG